MLMINKLKTNSHSNKLILIFSLLFFSTKIASGPIETAEPRHWLEVLNTNMSQEYPDPIPPGNTGPSAVMSAWSGGAYDTEREQLIVWGGGHEDYAGNELYGFSISTLTWSLIKKPSDTFIPCTQYMPDGQPGSHHTYNMLQYTASIDSFISVSGGGYGAGCPKSDLADKPISTDIFDLSTQSWSRGSKQPIAGHTTGRISAVDAATGHVWTHGTYGDGKLLQYDPLNDKWTIHSKREFLEIGGTAAIDPIRRLMVSVGGYNGARQIRVWNIDENYQYGIIPNTKGETILEYNENIGFVYDPTIKQFVGWLDDTAIYTLHPETWVWSKILPLPTNTVIPRSEANGTFGRFRYIPSKNIYILVNKTTENVYFYKLNSLPAISKPNIVKNVNVVIN